MHLKLLGFLVFLGLVVTGSLYNIQLRQQETQYQAPVIVQPHIEDTPQAPTIQLSEERIIELVNQERAAQGVKHLEISQELMRSADRKCQDFIDYRGYFAHENPTTGVNGWELAKEELPNARYWGENIAVGQYKDEHEPIKWWINSTSHYSAMVNSKYDVTGVSVCSVNPNGFKPSFFAVEHFADL